MACIISGNKMTLTGDVGEFWMSDGFTSGEVFTALALIDDDADITVYLNSGGGYASEGAAVHALLSRRRGRTDVVVDGIAASAASLIAMAGDTVTMSAGSVLMIHDPAVFTLGNVAEHAKSVAHLEALATAYARVYADKSGKTAAECRAIMKAEKWMSPEEAVSEGFADETSNDQAKPVAAFDYRAYAHAPQRLQALASKKKWSLPAAEDGPAPRKPTNTSKRKEPTMSDQQAHASATARIKAIMQAPEAESRKQLAEHLAFDTALDTDAALAIMKAAPAGDETNDVAEHENRRLNGEGLNVNGYGGRASTMRGGGIVAAMKQRHGVK